jgi:hypothetical protein
MTPTPVDLDALEAAARAATPGPWQVGYNDGSGRYESDKDEFCITTGHDSVLHASCLNPECAEDDAAYIAAASPDVILRLTAELRKARETIAAHHSGESVTAREFMATLDKDEELRKAREEHDALRDRVGQLESALAFYARPGSWQWGGTDTCEALEDEGKRARAVIEAGKNGRTTE